MAQIGRKFAPLFENITRKTNNMFNGIDKKFGASDYITEYFKTKETSELLPE